MAYAALGVMLLLGLLAAGRWYANAPPSSLFRFLKWAAVSLAVLLGGYLTVTGRLGLALFAAPALIPLFSRLRQFLRGARGPSGAEAQAGTGQSSEVRTRHVRMVLDHDSGEMNGDVLEGRFAGRTLGSLSLSDLLALLAESRDDPDSVQVLTAYLDRYHADDWRERASSGGRAAGSASGGMTREEALEILGLSSDADAAAIKAAHHRLMSKIHPDHGGSTYLAAKINQAKDLLLGS